MFVDGCRLACGLDSRGIDGPSHYKRKRRRLTLIGDEHPVTSYGEV